VVRYRSEIAARLVCLPEISPHGFLGILQQYLPTGDIPLTVKLS
jgi:hypothetical protein